MAQQLLARGELVESLVLMDSPGPGQMPVRLGAHEEIQDYFHRLAPVPGNHVTMLAEPHVRELARKVRGVLKTHSPGESSLTTVQAGTGRVDG
jgi:thioesterase domain-containing protein